MDAEKKYILLVEDSRTQALFARRLLEGAGYRVTVAETGRAGIELAQTTHPDLLLLDVVLPDIDGFEICRFVRRSVTTYIPILIFTGERTGMEDRIGALTTVGADDYLAKPYNPRELLAHVEALLRIKNTIDELLSRLTSEKISSMRGPRISHNTLRESSRGLRPPTLGTSILSSLPTSDARQQPYFCLIFSASANGVRSPTAMSFVS